MDRTSRAHRAPTKDALNEALSDGAILAALRPFARLLAPLVAAELASAAGEDWIDQETSPLGRRKHRELAKRGAFPAHKDGRRWRARRADVDAFIEAQRPGARLEEPPANHDAADDAAAHDAAVRAELAGAGLALAPGTTPPARRRRA